MNDPRTWHITGFAVRIVLTTLLLAGLGGSILEAGDTRGATLIVKMADGSRAYGELVRVERSSLVLAGSRSRPEKVLDIYQVATIEILGERLLEPRILNGLAIGVFLGLVGSSSHHDYHYDYTPQLGPVLLGILGGLGGFGMEFVGKRSEVISMTDLHNGREDLLKSLNRYARDGQRPWLHGFRISWRPYFHPPWPIRLGGRASLPEPHNGTATEMSHLRGQSYPNRLGRVRVDYDLQPWLLLGFEYVSLGAHEIIGNDYPAVVQDGQNYVSGLFTSGEIDTSAAFLGVSLGALSGPRAELGAGLAHSSVKDFGPSDGVTWVGDPARSVRLKDNLALQLGASWEFSPGSPISAGVFANYLILRQSFRGTTFNGQLNFYPGTELSTDKPVAFQLDSQLTYPPQRINLGGFTFGVFIRLR